VADFDALATFLNNRMVDVDNLSDANFNAKVGLSKTGTVRRASALVATSESTASTTITDLTTAGPSVTVNMPTGGFLLVYARPDISVTSGGTGFVSLDDGGTNLGDLISLAAASSTAMYSGAINLGLTNRGLARMVVIPNLSSGAHTFKLRYRVSAGTGTFANRQLWCITKDPT